MTSYKSYKDLLIDKNTNFTHGGNVPKIIFKTSWQTEIPKEIVYCLEKTKKLNKDYSLYYFNDADCEQFMKDYSVEYSVEAYESWKKLIPGAYKADFFRYCIIHKYGGCYSDIGHVMKESFDNIIGQSNLVLVKEREYQKVIYGIHNSLICSTPGNKIFKKAINIIIKNVKSKYYGKSAYDITGPSLLGKIFIKEFNIDSFEEIPIGEYVLKSVSIKMLYLDPQFYSINDGNNIVLFPKFDDYYQVMYPSDKEKIDYHHIWKNREVYLINYMNEIYSNNSKYLINTQGSEISKLSEISEYQIPKILFTDSELKMKDFLNILLDNQTNVEFLKTRFTEEIIKKYYKLPEEYNNLLLTYCLLYIYGGLYVSDNLKSKIELVNFELTDNKHQLYYIQDSNQEIEFIATTKGNNFILELISEMLNTYSFEFENDEHIFVKQYYELITLLKNELALIPI